MGKLRNKQTNKAKGREETEAQKYKHLITMYELALMHNHISS